MMWYFLNNIILYGHFCIFNATNVFLTLRQSIKLLITGYQEGQTSYEETAHFLVFNFSIFNRALVPPSPFPRPLQLT